MGEALTLLQLGVEDGSLQESVQSTLETEGLYTPDSSAPPDTQNSDPEQISPTNSVVADLGSRSVAVACGRPGGCASPVHCGTHGCAWG